MYIPVSYGLVYYESTLPNLFKRNFKSKESNDKKIGSNIIPLLPSSERQPFIPPRIHSISVLKSPVVS